MGRKVRKILTGKSSFAFPIITATKRLVGGREYGDKAEDFSIERLLGHTASKNARDELLNCRTHMCHTICAERRQTMENLSDILQSANTSLGELLRPDPDDEEIYSTPSGLSLTLTQRDKGFVDARDFCKLLELHQSVWWEGDRLSERELSMLTYFMHTDVHGRVCVEEFWSLKALWMLYIQKKDFWSTLVDSESISQRMLWQVLSKLNSGRQVCHEEVTWIMELSRECWAHSGCERESIFLALAYWYLSPKADSASGLDRLHLLQRLELEKRLKLGLSKFGVFLIWFISLQGMMTITNRSDSCRAIAINLEAELNLERVAEISTLHEVRQYFHMFSRASQKFSPSSQLYFGASDYMLLDGKTEFQYPVQLTKFDYVIGTNLTLQAWVMVDSRKLLPAGGVPILRKRLDDTIAGSDLSCWSWNFPPSFAYGAHDYGPSTANRVSNKMEEHIAAPYGRLLNGTTVYVEHEKPVLHTVVINSTSITFMIDDGISLGTMPLQRPLTDCSTEEIHLGSHGMTLTDVRFFPRVLSQEDVRDIFTVGGSLKDIGYVNLPEFMEPLTRIEETITRIRHLGTELAQNDQRISSLNVEAAQMTANTILHEDDDLASLEQSSTHAVSKVQDEVLNQTVWQVYGKPTYTSSSSIGTTPASHLPAGGTGFTISTWLRFETDSGQGYHLALAMPTINSKNEMEWTGWANVCWALYLGGDWTSIHAASSRLDAHAARIPAYFIFDKQAPKDWQFSGKSWRHVIARLDRRNESHPFMMCIDGVCSGQASVDKYSEEVNYNMNPPAADCSQTGEFQSYTSEQQQRVLNASLLLLNHRPPRDWPMKDSWQMSTKYFDTALSEVEIRKLFLEDPDPDDQARRPIRQLRGCRYGPELRDDRTWKDDFGLGCYWYFQRSFDRPEVCYKNPEAQAKCPMSCKSSALCWGTMHKSGEEMTIWPIQMEFRTKGAWGTTCVGKSTTPAKEAIRCGKGMPANATKQCTSLGIRDCSPKDCSEYEDDHFGLLNCLGDRVWFPQSGLAFDFFLPCKDIILLHEPHCDWDDSQLDRITPEIMKSQEWSISFWMEPLRAHCLEPQIRLLDGNGQVFSFVGHIQALIEDTPDAAGCNMGSWVSHGVVGKGPGYEVLAKADVYFPETRRKGQSQERQQKQFVVFGRLPDGSAAMSLDGFVNTEQVSSIDDVLPILGNKDFLRVINVAGNIRMGPWTLRSFFPDEATIGEIRFTQMGQEQVKRGPSQPMQHQFSQSVQRDVTRFAQNTLLVSPPILVQNRLQSGACKGDFAKGMADSYKERNEKRYCQPPYHCPDDYDASHVYTCAGDVEDSRFFGLDARTFDDEIAYVEYLTTIANSNILVRDGSLLNGSNFIDGLTSKVTLIALFVSVETGIISEMKIAFDAQGGSVRGKYDIRQFMVMIDMQDRRLFVCAFYLVFICCTIWCIGVVFYVFKRSWRAYRKKWARRRDFAIVMWSVLDATLVLTSALFSFWYAVLFFVDPDLKNLVVFDWHTRRNQEEVTSKYISQFSAVRQRISADQDLRKMAIYLSILMLLRLILTADMHPRIAVFTRTVIHAGSELLHFGSLSFLIFLGFAAMGSWRWGPVNADYASIMEGVFFQTDVILDPPGRLQLSHNRQSSDYHAFALCFQLLCFLFMLNFLLAIIVAAYSKVADEIRECTVEQDIISDVISLACVQWGRVRNNWPSRDAIIHHLRANLHQDCVRGTDMIPLFDNVDSAKMFCHFYARYPAIIHNADTLSDHQKEDPVVDKFQRGQDMIHHRLDMLIQKQAALSKLVQDIALQAHQKTESPEESLRYIVCLECSSCASLHDKFCGQCGAKLQMAPAVCQTCASTVAANNKFCSQCGAFRRHLDL